MGRWRGKVPTSDLARFVTVLSLPWIGRQRDGEEREETSPERGETTLGGKVEYSTFGTSRV